MIRHILALGLTLTLGVALAACESGPEPGKEGEYWGKKATDTKSPRDDREVALNHLLQVEDKGALPYLYELLKGEDPLMKPKVPGIVARIGDESSAEHLIAGIDFRGGLGNDKKSRATAETNVAIANALGKVAKKGDPKAAEALTRLSESSHVNTQLAAVVALGRMQAATAVQPLIDIADGHTNNFMVKNAVIALGDLADAKAVPVLMKLMFFERAGTSFYREASYALFQIGKPAVDDLVKLYNNQYEPIFDMHIEKGVQKAKALQVLSDIGGDPRIERICIEAAGIPPNDTANSLARVFGQQCVGKLGLEGGKAALMKSWDELDQSIAEHSLYALSQLGEKSLAGQLLGMTTFDGFVSQCLALDKRNKKEVCEAASAQVRPPRVTTLGRIAPGSMLGDFDKMVKDEEARQVKDDIKKFQATLVKTLKDSREMVAAAKECDGQGEACFIKLLGHENPRFRERAAYELLWLGKKRSDAANEALIKALGDKDNEARYAAILAVWRSLPKSGKEAVTQILESEAGQNQYVRINEDLKRIEIKLARGY